MNTKYIYKISNYLFICMLALAVLHAKTMIIQKTRAH